MQNIFTLTFGLTFAYFITGFFSNSLLAIDGYAVASWPPSGIALAGFLLCGRRALVGVLLGALLTNMIHLDRVADILHWQVFLQALAVSFAAVLQAWVGCYCIVKIIKAPLDLSSLKHSVQSLIIAGPACCVIAAAIGTSLLVSNNIIPVHTAFDNFVAWWIGDSIGVLIFTPLILAAFNYEQMRHRLQVILPATLIYIVISVSFYAAASVKKDKDIQKQEAKVAEVRLEINHKLDEVSAHLALLSTFFASSDEVSYAEFKRFTTTQLNYSNEVLALEWVPNVPLSTVAQYQQQIRLEGFNEFYIKEQSPQQQWQSVTKRDSYYPVQYVHPMLGNEEVLGFDLASNAQIRNVMMMSKALNELIISEPMKLVQSNNDDTGVLFFFPVFGDLEMQGDFRGFVVGVINLARLADTLQINHRSQISMHFYDVTDAQQRQLIYRASRTDSELLSEYQLVIGQRIWQVQLFEPTTQTSWIMYWFAQILGMLFVWLLITFLISVTGTNIQVREQVAQQTRVLRQEKQKADEASQIKSQFLANMSHEVRTPINGIKGLHYLALQQQDWQQARHYIEQADGALSVLLRVLNDVLDFSKMEAGKLDLIQEPIALNQLIDELVNLVKFDVDIKSLKLILELDNNADLQLDSDPIRLKQVLLNLLNNAIKFTATGTITLKVWQQQDVTYFSVSDTGIGISQVAQQQLFQPFAQADSSTSRQFGGTGLGLSICKKLVELMGGNISLVSEEGQGSTFTFTLPRISPLAKAEQLEPLFAEIDTSTLSLAEFKILLVEDNPLNQHVATAILKTKGCIADVASDGFEAIEKVSETRYDLVLMDIQMPNMDGLQATKVIRDELFIHQLPIIALSANAHDDDVKKALAAGMNGYLTKPIDAEKLFKTIWHYLQKSSD
ncbi:CHASE domain-containing protein [Pseudoalteromonas sp. SR41-4]|uniref:CHASE domain-containing protein n=1 Tax=Pseudoalteromonas sp. SR41-4 TaxID=2760950 RepID=UPI001601FBF2|nr:CHASE domain-containing protein [Pseudoalteromonas sp. SR41-4]MBB1292487.1 CHASE domain-containing protein [Pseudoalteromonas sp. SR41-4]